MDAEKFCRVRASACRDAIIPPNGAQWQQSKSNNLFLQKVLYENYGVLAANEMALKKSDENPRVRAQKHIDVISAELKAFRREIQVELARRQLLRQNVIELRDLDVELRAAATRRQVSEQRDAINSTDEQKRLKRIEENRKVAEEIERTAEILRQIDIDEAKKRRAYGDSLLRQMAEREQLRAKEFEQVMCEKDERLQQQRRDEELRRAEAEKMQRLKEAKKREVSEFMRARDEFMQSLRKQDQGETKQTELEQKMVEERKLAFERTIQATRDRKEVMSDHIGQHTMAIAKRRREYQEMLEKLTLDEVQSRENKKFRDSLYKQAEERERLRIEKVMYLERSRLEKKLMKDKEERIYRAERERAWAEETKKLEAEEKRKLQKKLLHQRQLEEMRELERLQRKAQRAENLRDDQLLREWERKKCEEIEAERIRLLRSQPIDVLRHLGPRVLRRTECDILGLTGIGPAICLNNH